MTILNQLEETVVLLKSISIILISRISLVKFLIKKSKNYWGIYSPNIVISLHITYGTPKTSTEMLFMDRMNQLNTT